MKRLFSMLLLAAMAASMSGQSNGSRLIVRADDMGSSHSANMANMETFEKGYVSSIEVMVVAPWFPEAARILREHPSVDVGLHFAITSEWDNIKWRPLTNCPSLVDKDGYFLPMMGSNKNYPGLAILENQWDLQEVEQELRAQIEMGIRNIPHITHISGHMGSCSFAPEVEAMVTRVAKEYGLGFVEKKDSKNIYTYIGYDGPNTTADDKISSFLKAIEQFEKGKNYLFLDHPAYNDNEMAGVHHIGYEHVASDRQGVAELFTSDKVKQALKDKNIDIISYNELLFSLPRSKAANKKMDKAFAKYLTDVAKANEGIHSIMVVQHGQVIAEKWLDGHSPKELHGLWSVSKTFTSMAVGFAIAEGRIKTTDQVIKFFPEELPENVSDNLKKLEIRHLLTMSSGHDVDPTSAIRNGEGKSWVAGFFAAPLVHEPGTQFVYNSLGTYMLSAIVQKVAGEKIVDYLRPRLFRPLGIAGVKWDESPQGINCGGWGLHVRTEDMAKLGLFILQKGQWNGQQLLPAAWIEEATTSKIASLPAGVKRENLNVKPKDSDWLQGYGYQIWRCRHRAFRADGAGGQYIIMLPDKDAVIVTTAQVNDMQAEINRIWKHLLPAL